MSKGRAENQKRENGRASPSAFPSNKTSKKASRIVPVKQEPAGLRKAPDAPWRLFHLRHSAEKKRRHRLTMATDSFQPGPLEQIVINVFTKRSRNIQDFDRGCVQVIRSAAAMLALSLFIAGVNASAVTLPGSADAGRVDVDRKEAIPQPPANAEVASLKTVLPGEDIPQGAEKVRFTLKEIEVEGATAFPASEVEDLYRDNLNHEITLDTIWKIAAEITRHYEDAGYFLSRAFVPQQDIKGGLVRIRVVEGYVGEVRLNDPLADNRIVADLIERLKAERPAMSQTVEGILLRLNDLPGVSFRSVIEPVEDETKNEGAVRLMLIRERKKGTGSVSFDNYSSRYLGPFEGAASYETSLLPLQETSVSSLVGVPARKLEYWSASHVVPLTADLSLQVSGGYTEANPGFTLSQKDIDSDAANLGLEPQGPVHSAAAGEPRRDVDVRRQEQLQRCAGERLSPETGCGAPAGRPWHTTAATRA